MAKEVGDRWVDAGRFTTCSVVNDQIYALIYWSEGFAAQDSPDEETLHDSGAAWFLVFADDPNAHIKLSGPQLLPVSPNATSSDYGEALRSALTVARRIIRERLGLG